MASFDGCRISLRFAYNFKYLVVCFWMNDLDNYILLIISLWKENLNMTTNEKAKVLLNRK